MKVITYLKNVLRELEKVVFPTRKELQRSTIIVFAICIFFALVFWGINSGILAIFRGIV